MINKKSTEVWKSVPGYKGFYEVSHEGSVRSQPRTITNSLGRRCSFPGKILKQGPDSYGYPTVALQKQGERKNFGVHSLVLLAFIGRRPKGQECCHEDGNKTNNKLKNLRYGTSKSNHADKRRHGTSPKGGNNGRALLSRDDVVRIRYLSAKKRWTSKKLGRRYGVSIDTVRDIVRRRTWIHLDDEGNELALEEQDSYKSKFAFMEMREPVRKYSVQDKELTLQEWSKKLGVSKGALVYRLKSGRCLEDVFTSRKHFHAST